MKLASLSGATVLLAALMLPVAAGGQQAAPADPAADQGLTSRVEQRIGKLRDALGITAAEAVLWDQYAQVARANALDMARAFDRRRAMLASMTAAGSMQSLADIAAQHAQNMQRLASAFQRLYGIMQPEQRKVADEILRNGDQPQR